MLMWMGSRHFHLLGPLVLITMVFGIGHAAAAEEATECPSAVTRARHRRVGVPGVALLQLAGSRTKPQAEGGQGAAITNVSTTVPGLVSASDLPQDAVNNTSGLPNVSDASEDAPPPSFAAALRRAAEALGTTPSRLESALRGKHGPAAESASGTATRRPAGAGANVTEAESGLDQKLPVERHSSVRGADIVEDDALAGASQGDATASGAQSSVSQRAVTLPAEDADSAGDGEGYASGMLTNASARGVANASGTWSGNSSAEVANSTENVSTWADNGTNGSAWQSEPANSSAPSNSSLDEATSGVDSNGTTVPSSSTSAAIGAHVGSDVLPNSSNTSVVGGHVDSGNTSNGTVASQTPAPTEERPWWWFLSPFYWKHSSSSP